MATAYDRVGWLLTPAGEEETIRSSANTAADVLVPDLEDGTTYPDEGRQEREKQRARELLADIASSGGPDGAAFYPRMNALDSPYWEADVETLVPAGLDGLVVPMLRSIDRLRQLVERMEALERQAGLKIGSVGLALMIETPYSRRRAFDLASVDDRVDALVFGPGDFSVSLGTLRDDEHRLAEVHSVFDPVRLELSSVASELGIDAIGGPPSLYSLLTDGDYTPDGYEFEHCNRAARMGMDGKLVLHPSHLGPVHRGFAPSRAEVEKAKRMIAFREEARERGERAVKMLDSGEMFVPALIEQAENTLTRYEQLGAREEV